MGIGLGMSIAKAAVTLRQGRLSLARAHGQAGVLSAWLLGAPPHDSGTGPA